MLTWIIDWSLRNRWLVIGGTVALAFAGILAFRALPIDAFPDTTPTQVQINAVAPALGPLEVERQLTMPIEWAVAGLPHLDEMRSISKFGLSQVTLQFEDGTDLWIARQVTAERLQAVDLPAGAERPNLGPVATGRGEVVHYLVTGEGKALEELRTVQDWIIAPQLRSVRGVAEINAWGGAEKQWHVVADPRRLQMFGVSMGDLYRALEENNANVGGGVIEHAGSASLVQGVALIEDGAQLGDVVITARDGVPIRVRDVGRVDVGHEIRRGATTADGKGEAVLGLGFMLMNENSHVVTQDLAARLEEVKRSLPAGIDVEPVYERTWLVDLVLATVERNLFEGALLVIAVLFVFLGNVRAGLIVALAIPLSMLFACNAMLRFGIAGTLMSLGAIDFGLVVDSSVILVENAERRLAEARGRRSVIDVVRDAAVEVRQPTLFGELIIMVVYLPILALEGVEGKLFRPLALTVIFALLGSAILSMTLMPVLASFVLGTTGTSEHREPRAVVFAKRLYRPVLGWALAHTRAVLVGATVVVVAGALAATRLGAEFVPRLSEGTIVINTVRLAEVSLSESIRYGTQVEKVLLAKFPHEVRRVWVRTGTAEVATDPMGIELSDVFITLKPRDEWTRATTQDQLVAEMKAELGDLPGTRMAFLQPIEMRVNEMIAGVRSDVGIKIFGDDLDLLKAKAREVEAVVRDVPGAADVTVEQVTGQPVMQVVVDRAAIARFGIAARDVLDVVEAVGTRKVGVVREGDRQFDVAVTLEDAFRTDPTMLATALVTAPGGERIPLGRLVTIREVSGPTTIQREWGRRRIVVQANVRGRDLGSFVDEVRQRIDERVVLPTGYFVRLGGQFENLTRAQERLAIVVPVALALIFVLLYVTYRRVLDALRIFVGVPLALVGGVLALMLRDIPFSISAAVGFIALSGVSVLGDMVLVSRVRQLLDRGADMDQAVREAALSRLPPVLMTASVASLGFLPMALNTGVGAEVQRPLATVVIGGIVSSTLLTLVVLPVLYVTFGRRQQTARAAQTILPHASGATMLLAMLFGAAPVRAAERLALPDAVRIALSNNPELLAARQDVGIADARLTKSRYWSRFNPEIGGQGAHREFTAGGGGNTEYAVVGSQEIEIAGQRGKRIEEAERNAERVLAQIRDKERLLAGEVTRAFFAAIVARRRLALQRTIEEVNTRTLDATKARVDAGESPRMDVNLAEIRHGQARRETIAAEARVTATTLELKRLLGFPPERALEPSGKLRGTPDAPSQIEALETALAQRPDLAAAKAEVERVRAEIALVRRGRIPNPTIEGFYETEAERDGGRDRIVGGGIRIPLPIFDRQQAEMQVLTAEEQQARHRLDATRQAVEAEVVAALREYEAAARALAVLESSVLEPVQKNFEFIETGYREGKLDLTEFIVVQNDLTEAEMSYLDSLATFRDAEANLATAIGAEGGR